MLLNNYLQQKIQKLCRRKLLRIEPPQFVRFSHVVPSFNHVTLHNQTEKLLTFKLQTTSQQKFSARPCVGIIRPNQSVKLYIGLRAGAKLSHEQSDKFLVLVMPLRSSNPGPNLEQLWCNKSTKTPNIEQHRLVATYKYGFDSRAAGKIKSVRTLLENATRCSGSALQLTCDASYA